MDLNASPTDPSKVSLAWLPLAEAVSIQTLQEHLASRSPPEVLAQLRQWLAELVLHAQYPLERWLEAIEQIDRLAELHQFRLVPQHLEVQRLHKVCESELWQTTLAYWQQLDQAYLHCLLRMPSCSGGADSTINRATLLSKLIRNLARQHKSLLLAHQRVEERIWRDLGHGYLLAESWGLAGGQGLLPASRQSELTPRKEMLKVLMLAMAAPDALSPGQLHIAERLTSSLADHFVLDTQAGPGCDFCFDLMLCSPPTRAQAGANAPVSGRQRFFGAGSAIPALQGLAIQLRRRANLPPEVALGGEFPPSDILAAIGQLERHWADLRPARRDARVADHTRLTVLPGLMSSMGWLAQQQPDGRLAPPRSPRTEHWNTVDRSERGFGTTLPARPPGWLSIGALAAVQTETGAALRIGIARRITATPDGRWHIGVELLGQQAMRVTLHPDLPRQDNSGMPAGQAAILLNSTPEKTGMAELLLPAGIFEHAASLQMQLGAHSFRIEAPETAEQGRDYRRVRYRLLQQT